MSTSYMGTELIDFLKRPGTNKDVIEATGGGRNPLLDQGYSFNNIIGGNGMAVDHVVSQRGTQSSSQ